MPKVIQTELPNKIEAQIIEILRDRGYNLDHLYFDHGTPYYICTNYCCNHLFIIHYNDDIESLEWNEYKLNLIDSIQVSELCTNHRDGSTYCKKVSDGNDDDDQMLCQRANKSNSTHSSDSPRGGSIFK